MDPQPFDLELDPQALSSARGRRGGTTPPPSECCSTPTLACDSISASKSKCGYTEFAPSDPPKYYLVKTSVSSGSYDAPPPPGCTGTATNSWSSTRVDTTDEDTCVQSCTSASGSSSVDVPWTGPFCSPCSSSGAASCSGGNTSFCGFGSSDIRSYTGCAWTFTPICNTGIEAACAACGPSVVDTATVETSTWACNPAPGNINVNTTLTVTLSSEYTTASLIANTEAALPSYPGTFSGSCSASRDLSDDETTYSIQRFKYKFTWADPLPSDCKISWIERTYDSDGNPVSDTPMSETVLAGETESTVYEVMEPADNGTVGVVFPIGACCTAGVCSTTDATTCTDGGGTFHSSCKADPCSPNPC